MESARKEKNGLRGAVQRSLLNIYQYLAKD